MNSKVYVVADNDGSIITVSKTNPEWGHVRVEQFRLMMDDKGFGRTQRLQALIPGKVAELSAFKFTEGQEIPGKIVVKESTKPFNPKNPERDVKIAGTSGVVCKLGEEVIYRKNFYTENADAHDDTVEHTNHDEILDAYEAMKSSVHTPSKEFSA